ncbi:MAG: GAF domain-containing protein, partial [Collinsella sp.]
VTPPRIFGRRAPRVLVALHSIEEQYSHDRQLKRALSELRVANKRLSGTLSVIMSTVGSDELPSLLDTVLNQLVGTLDASGAAIYFSESGGFKLRGVSKELEDSYLPEFMPYGAGIPTYVLRESRACRLSIQQDLEGDRVASGMFMDLDNRSKHLLRVQDMPPYRSEICLPVFYGTQVLGVLEVGWKRPQAPLAYDVNVLEVICDYLSIQLVGMASSLRSRRTAELGRSLNLLRDELFTYLDDPLPLRERCRRKSARCSIVISAPWNMTRVLTPMSSILRAAVAWRCRETLSRSSFPPPHRLRVWGLLPMVLGSRCWAVRALMILSMCA